MTRYKKIAAAGAAVAALGAGGAAVANATGGENDKPIKGSALDKASAAALAHTGQGFVSDTEVGDEESLYEVEVTLDNGDETDVQLNAGFDVVGEKTDTPNANEKAGE